MVTEFLNQNRKLLDEVADWLCGAGPYEGRGRIRRLPEGAEALDHVMVVVPTAQSGRNLRLAIARRFKGRGVIPPRVVQPMQLVAPASEMLREATPCEVAAAFQQYVKGFREDVLKLDCLVRAEEFEDLTARFALLDQLEDIWRTLAGNGLLMRDVLPRAREKLAAEFGDEERRWEQLGALEAGFFRYLHERGLVYPTERVQRAKTATAIVDAGVEEIIVPALADPIRILKDVLVQQERAGKRLTVLLHVNESERHRFTEWGVPLTTNWTGAARPTLERLADRDIVAAGTGAALVRAVAADFPAASSGAALPALALCDGELYNGLAAAFLNRNYVVHNPERNLLSRSSLGRMIRSLMVLYSADTLPWREFVAVFRGDDVLSALGLFGERRVEVLAGLDIAQNAYIPTELPHAAAFPEDADMRSVARQRFVSFCEQASRFERIVLERRHEVSLAVFLREMLKWIYAKRAFPTGSDGKEFLAAAEATREFLNALEGDFVSSLPMSAAEFAALARRQLDAAVYSLEPDSADAIRTEGWLELAWSPADRLALVGLHEGKVPDSIVGHPFLPDKLRTALGLVSNADRMARDSWLLQELLAAHAPHAVKVYVARTNGAGDICRPSRLLYLCSDCALVTRVEKLFGDLPEERVDKRRQVDWMMRLPDALAPVDHYSVSAIDTYVKCPFTYLLQNGLKMKPYADKQELEANDFGILAHAVLEDYARRQIERGDDQLTDAGEIRRLLCEEIYPNVRAKYGRTTLNIDLQLRALEGRLAIFAERQAKRAQDGWRIRMAEQEIPKDLGIPGLGFCIHGFIDRVDENINPGVTPSWCVIDYKTWNENSLVGHVHTSAKNSEKNRRQQALACQLGFPLFRVAQGKRSEEAAKNQRILSVQLPVYGKALAALRPEIPFADIGYGYFVLSEKDESSGFVDLPPTVVAPSLETAKRAVGLIRQNVFWPPGPDQVWERDFKNLFVSDPIEDLSGTDWVKRQQRKLEADHD